MNNYDLTIEKKIINVYRNGYFNLQVPIVGVPCLFMNPLVSSEINNKLLTCFLYTGNPKFLYTTTYYLWKIYRSFYSANYFVFIMLLFLLSRYNSISNFFRSKNNIYIYT